MDCAAHSAGMWPALLGALVVLANALSAYVVVKTRLDPRREKVFSGRPVVAAHPTPQKRRRKRLAPKSVI
jgi:hypothetical protein